MIPLTWQYPEQCSQMSALCIRPDQGVDPVSECLVDPRDTGAGSPGAASAGWPGGRNLVAQCQTVLGGLVWGLGCLKISGCRLVVWLWRPSAWHSGCWPCFDLSFERGRGSFSVCYPLRRARVYI